MRLLIVTAISMLMLISGAFAQSNSSSATPSERAKRETQDLEKARSDAQRPGAKGDKQNATQTEPERNATQAEPAEAEHPGWFSENKTYKACPAVGGINGRNICLGCPGRCPYPPPFQPSK